MRIKTFVLFLLPLTLHASLDCKQRRGEVRSLRPTQFAVGMREVEEKRQELAEQSEKQLAKYLCANPIPVVIGPGGKEYVVDHHHLGLALILDKIAYAYLETREDLSGEKEGAFWSKMEKGNYVYLRNEAGTPKATVDLPSRLQDLKDDPYRSLAYYVRKQGGYKKTRALFAEFQWAEYFRARVTVGATDRDFKAAVAAAVKIAHSEDARALPGYTP